MATLDDVATFLASACSLTVGTSLFKGRMPEGAQDEAAALYEYGGMSSEYTFGTSGVTFERPRMQVVLRGEPNDYSGPRETAETAYRAMAAVGNQSLGSTRYMLLEPIQAPFFLKRDENSRFYIAFNVQAMKELSA